MTDERVTFFIQKAGWSNYEISQHFKKLKNLVELVESCTLTKQKAKWYQEGVEAEREACKREWVELTKDDVDSWFLLESPTVYEFSKYVEAKLKAKNDFNFTQS